MVDYLWSMDYSYYAIYEEAKENAISAFSHNRAAIIKALSLVSKVNDVVKNEGLLAVEECVDMMSGQILYEQVWTENILMLIDGMDIDVTLEYISNDYFTREKNPVTTWLYLIYMYSLRYIDEQRRELLKEHSSDNQEDIHRTEEIEEIKVLKKEIISIITNEYKSGEVIELLV